MAADVHNLSLVLLLNFCAKFELTVFKCRHKRQAVKRCSKCKKRLISIKKHIAKSKLLFTFVEGRTNPNLE
jgi:hypothetical protein